jgi:Ala-tRNA(Pro) deacylase
MTASPASEHDLMTRLAGLGIETTTMRHAAMHTVEESRQIRGDLPGGHCKSLFLKDKKSQIWLVVALEDRKIDLKELPKRIGSGRLSFGKPELLLEVLGVHPGSVTPFALINDPDHQVNVVLDADMLQHEPLNYHPLHNEATTAISAADLKRFIEATGHTCNEVDLDVPLDDIT